MKKFIVNFKESIAFDIYSSIMVIVKSRFDMKGVYEMTTWYGSLQNRLMENAQFDGIIEVGTGITEIMYSDRRPYEVIDVKDQKHITVRSLDHKMVGEAYSNNWELVSNDDNPTYELTKRGKYWYWTVEITADILDTIDDINTKLFLLHNDVDVDRLKEKGKVTKYHRANIVVGFADYYYDYEF